MTGPVVNQVVFDNESGVRVVASSADDHVTSDRWSAWMEKFVRLEAIDERPPPASALSYFQLDRGEAAVLHRWREHDSSPARNPSRALVGPADVLTVPVALGLAWWSEWTSMPRSGRLAPLPAAAVVQAAERAVGGFRPRLARDPDPMTRMLAALMLRPRAPMSIIGVSPEQAVPLMWGLNALGEPWLAAHDLTREWTFSTYQHDHRSTVADLPSFVFLPTPPRAQGEVHRTVVTLDPRIAPQVSPQAWADAQEMVRGFLAGEPVAVSAAVRGQAAAPADARAAERSTEVGHRAMAARQEGGGIGQLTAPSDGYGRSGGPRDGLSGGRPPVGVGSTATGSFGSTGSGRPAGGTWSAAPRSSKEADLVLKLLKTTDADAFRVALGNPGLDLQNTAGRERLRQALSPEIVDELAAVLLVRTGEGDRRPLAEQVLQAALGSRLEDLGTAGGQDFMADLIEHCRSPWFLRVVLTTVHGSLGTSRALTLAATNVLLDREGLRPVERNPEERRVHRGGLRAWGRRPLSGPAQRTLRIAVLVLSGLALLLTFLLGYAVASPDDPAPVTGPTTPTTTAQQPPPVVPPAPLPSDSGTDVLPDGSGSGSRGTGGGAGSGGTGTGGAGVTGGGTGSGGTGNDRTGSGSGPVG